MAFKPYTLELTGDPEVDDRRLAEYQKKMKEWKATERVADEAAEVDDLSYSFICDDPDVYAEAFNALNSGTQGRKPFSEMFEALPLGDGTFKVRLRRGTILPLARSSDAPARLAHELYRIL